MKITPSTCIKSIESCIEKSIVSKEELRVLIKEDDHPFSNDDFNQITALLEKTSNISELELQFVGDFALRAQAIAKIIDVNRNSMLGKISQQTTIKSKNFKCTIYLEGS